MSLFNFNSNELLTFVAVLVRYSVLISVLPFVGDRRVPVPVKILLSLAITIALFPALVAEGLVRPADAAVWGASPSGIIGTIALETLFGLALGFTARLAFDTISFGGNLIGNFMGFGIASTYDPSEETQTQVVAEFQMAIAMLTFLALDGHILMLRAALESYAVVGVGGLAHFVNLGFNGAFADKLVELTGQVIRFGVQISAPVAVVLFGVNLVFGIMAKAMPQLNILVLSVSLSALVGLAVIFLTVPEFHGVANIIFSRMDGSMDAVMRAMKEGK